MSERVCCERWPIWNSIRRIWQCPECSGHLNHLEAVGLEKAKPCSRTHAAVAALDATQPAPPRDGDGGEGDG
jgi:hypothetical protein